MCSPLCSQIESDSQWERSSSPASDLASLRSEAMEDAIELADITDTAYRSVPGACLSVFYAGSD